MDEQLAAIYGTGQENFDSEDLQKTAAAELLVKLAAENNVDLNQYSDEDIAEMIGELYGEEKTAGEVPPALAAVAAEKKEEKKDEGEKKEEKEKEDQEKVAEADFLGRTMAHAYVQELNNIEKEAGKLDAVKAGLGAVKDKVVGAARSVGGAAKGASEKSGLKGIIEGQKGAMSAKKGLKQYPASAGAYSGLLEGAKKTRAEGAKTLGKGVAKYVGLPAGLAGLGYAAGKTSTASANESAIEALAQEHAFDMAKEAGWVNEEGELLYELPQQEEEVKEASALDQVVAQRALEICAESGLPVEWEQ